MDWQAVIAYPLALPLARLPQHGRVYVVRAGLAFLYPVCIMLDAPGDRYASPADCPWEPTARDWAYGNRLAGDLRADVARDPGRWRERVQALAWNVWRHVGRYYRQTPDYERSQFDFWWEAVNPNADPRAIGAAAAIAAREVMTYSLFRHRHLCAPVDGASTSA